MGYLPRRAIHCGLKLEHGNIAVGRAERPKGTQTNVWAGDWFAASDSARRSCFANKFIFINQLVIERRRIIRRPIAEPAAAFALSAEDLAVRSPYADPGLHARAVEELEQALALKAIAAIAAIRRTSFFMA